MQVLDHGSVVIILTWMKTNDWLSVYLPQLSFIKDSLSHKGNLSRKSQDIAVNVFLVLYHLKNYVPSAGHPAILE